ncbi:sugar phosphate isomerase [Planctomycetales bacterium]|nr:sugar phosphate isomerase [Planctomycetales bacterium]
MTKTVQNFSRQTLQRRNFLKTAAVSAVGLSSLSSFSFAAEGKHIPLSVQVYSVRKAAEKDLSGTLKKLAEIGFEAVEFAGYYGKDAKEIRKYLDDAGIQCSGTHTQLTDIRKDFDKVVEIHKTLGTKYIIVPWINPKEFDTAEKIEKYADEFNGYAEKAKQAGMAVGYHAHAGDAQQVDGKTAFERFFEKTTSDVVMQVDVGNYMSGGGDPYKMLELFKGRAKTIHIKEFGGTAIGTGKVDWKKVFDLCETVGGTEWYVIEDEVKADSFDTLIADYAGMKKLGKTK